MTFTTFATFAFITICMSASVAVAYRLGLREGARGRKTVGLFEPFWLEHHGDPFAHVAVTTVTRSGDSTTFEGMDVASLRLRNRRL